MRCLKQIVWSLFLSQLLASAYGSMQSVIQAPLKVGSALRQTDYISQAVESAKSPLKFLEYMSRPISEKLDMIFPDGMAPDLSFYSKLPGGSQAMEGRISRDDRRDASFKAWTQRSYSSVSKISNRRQPTTTHHFDHAKVEMFSYSNHDMNLMLDSSDTTVSEPKSIYQNQQLQSTMSNSTIPEVKFFGMQYNFTALSVLSDPYDVTSPGDSVVPTSRHSPLVEQWDNAIDNTDIRKYLNFDKAGSGLTVTTGPSIVTGMTLMSGNDAPLRDPSSYLLEGSNDKGATFTEINSAMVPRFTERNQRQVLKSFTANREIYSTYRLTFPTIVGGNVADAMQIAEIELLGTKLYSETLTVELASDESIDYTNLFVAVGAAFSLDENYHTNFQEYPNNSTLVSAYISSSSSSSSSMQLLADISLTLDNRVGTFRFFPIYLLWKNLSSSDVAKDFIDFTDPEEVTEFWSSHSKMGSLYSLLDTSRVFLSPEEWNCHNDGVHGQIYRTLYKCSAPQDISSSMASLMQWSSQESLSPQDIFDNGDDGMEIVDQEEYWYQMGLPNINILNVSQIQTAYLLANHSLPTNGTTCADALDYFHASSWNNVTDALIQQCNVSSFLTYEEGKEKDYDPWCDIWSQCLSRRDCEISHSSEPVCFCPFDVTGPHCEELVNVTCALTLQSPERIPTSVRKGIRGGRNGGGISGGLSEGQLHAGYECQQVDTDLGYTNWLDGEPPCLFTADEDSTTFFNISIDCRFNQEADEWVDSDYLASLRSDGYISDPIPDETLQFEYALIRGGNASDYVSSPPFLALRELPANGHVRFRGFDMRHISDKSAEMYAVVSSEHLLYPDQEHIQFQLNISALPDGFRAGGRFYFESSLSYQVDGQSFPGLISVTGIKQVLDVKGWKLPTAQPEPVSFAHSTFGVIFLIILALSVAATAWWCRNKHEVQQRERELEERQRERERIARQMHSSD